MIILTGPQITSEQRGELDEVSAIIDARLTCSPDVDWVSVTALYTLKGWEACPLAVADVDIATAVGLPVLPLHI
ncbi:hypothetical protein ACQEVG_32955 [Streptomyces sp. CA-135486]|uniref:hypothetical protein n=1 Tax=Streptomyces sp. CA-135486 TaxID=3240049 RepID=UPI003D915CB3